MDAMAKILSVKFSETSMDTHLKVAVSFALNFLYTMTLKTNTDTLTKKNVMLTDTTIDKNGMMRSAITMYRILLH